jgi:hypothetical protein
MWRDGGTKTQACRKRHGQTRVAARRDFRQDAVSKARPEGRRLILSKLSRPLIVATLALACCTQLHAQTQGRDGSGNLSGRGSAPRDGAANLIAQGRAPRDGSGNLASRGSSPRDGAANLIDRAQGPLPRGR